jgi:DNA-binding transcriptional MerR regulator
MAAVSRYAIGDLAALGGVSRRTVRYYVHEGLISAPLGVGRGNHYSGEHLDQLLRVKELQQAGRTLDEIRRLLGLTPGDRTGGDTPPEKPPLSRSLWRRLSLAPGIELHVASTVRLPPPARLRELADWCRLNFADTNEKDDREGEDGHA